ncbi:MAG: hypothetical protein OXH11_12805 [Candidatus Aminicenantes bacterium]|nr:hypothetical protein [Candidatus Aminicenantes bacterium]
MTGPPPAPSETGAVIRAIWSRRGWLAASLLVVLSCAAWTWISFRFRYGEGHADRPILTFVLLYACAWAGFFLGYLQLRRGDRQAPLLLIVATALVARVLLLSSGLIQENDVYRYVLDGQVLLAGENPYEQSPLELSLLPPEPVERALSDPAAEQVISRIGYAEIPTLYPPAAQAAFAAGGLISGWNWIGLRVLFTLFDLALMGLIVLLLTRIGSSPSRVLLYAWNPLVLKEVTNSVHVDVLPAFFVVLLMVSLERTRPHGGWRWLLVAAGSMAAGVLSKLYPILLLPAAVRFISLVSGGKRAVTFAAASLAGIVLGYVPFLSLDLDRLTEGLRSYAERWRMNQGAFDLLEVLLPQPRLACGILILAVAVAVPWVRLRSRGSPAELIGACHWVLLLWFLLLPAPFPWYAVVLAALLPAAPRFALTAPAVVALSGAAGLYYLSFYYEYQRFPEAWWTWTRLAEHGLIWGTLGFTWLQSRRRGDFQSPSRRGTGSPPQKGGLSW